MAFPVRGLQYGPALAVTIWTQAGRFPGNRARAGSVLVLPAGPESCQACTAVIILIALGCLSLSLSAVSHTKARLVTYPVRGLHYGPTLKVVTLDLQEPLPKYILVLTLENHDSAGRRHGPAIA